MTKNPYYLGSDPRAAPAAIYMAYYAILASGVGPLAVHAVPTWHNVAYYASIYHIASCQSRGH